jgi:hypothetical protein
MRRRQQGGLGLLSPAPRASKPRPHFGQAARPAGFSDLEAVQRPCRPAAPTFDLQRAAKADKIGSGSDMLRGHSPPLGWRERFVNIQSLGRILSLAANSDCRLKVSSLAALAAASPRMRSASLRPRTARLLSSSRVFGWTSSKACNSQRRVLLKVFN